MIEVVRSATFDNWMSELKDIQARARIAARIDRLASGNAGNTKALAAGVSELKIDYGPGYRVYFMRRGGSLAILLYGGDKRTQGSDIKRALKMAPNWKK